MNVSIRKRKLVIGILIAILFLITRSFVDVKITLRTYNTDERVPGTSFRQTSVYKSWKNHTCDQQMDNNRNNILCMKPPTYLPQYKNPCWFEDNSTKLSCLPYFLQIGVSKCGTTDLYYRSILHPDIVPIIKEDPKIYWWDRKLTGSAWASPYSNIRAESFLTYTEYFNHPANVIQNSIDSDGKHMKITGEGSPTYIWMLYLWKKIPQNQHLNEPRFLVPDLIRHVLPNMKFIVILRDPIDRMHSSYYYFKEDSKSNVDEHTFHSTMLSGIRTFNACRSVKGDRLCVLDPDIRHTLSLENARFINGMYYILIKEWLDVFPRDQFLFIKMEEFIANKQDVLNRVFTFLGVRTLTHSEMEKHGLLNKTIKNKSKGDQQFRPMLNKTREMLYAFYDPYTKRLPELLNDASFVWPKVSYEEYVKKFERKRAGAN